MDITLANKVVLMPRNCSPWRSNLVMRVIMITTKSYIEGKTSKHPYVYGYLLGISPNFLGHSAGCLKVSKTIASIPPIFVVKKGIMVMFRN